MRCRPGKTDRPRTFQRIRWGGGTFGPDVVLESRDFRILRRWIEGGAHDDTSDAPALGAHNEHILSELGYGPSDIAELTATEALATEPPLSDDRR